MGEIVPEVCEVIHTCTWEYLQVNNGLWFCRQGNVKCEYVCKLIG